MISKRAIIPAVLLAFFLAAHPAAHAKDFQFYKVVKHSTDISFEGRTVNDIRDMHAVSPQGLKLGKIKGVLIGAGGSTDNENRVTAVILDLRHKIAKDKTVVVSVDDVKFDPMSRKLIIIKKSQDQLRALRNWQGD